MDSVKQRDYYFDNLKFILILLVVLGHVIEPIIYTRYGIKFLYVFIYSFHMPLFAFVSGYFSKNYKLIKITKRIIIPYLVFQTLYFLFNRYIIGDIGSILTFFTPYWIMWYLLSLFMWQLVLPLFRFRYSVIIALVIGIIAGYDTSVGYFFSLSRTVYFFPFFLIGYKFDKGRFLNLVAKKYQTALSIVYMIYIGIILYCYTYQVDIRLFYGSYPYAQLNLNIWYAGVYRLLSYSFTLLVSFFILYLIPVTKCFFSVFGARTLNVYLLHGFIIKLLAKYDIYKYLSTQYEILFLVLTSIAITFILTQKLFDNIMKPLSLLKLEKLYGD